MCKWPYCQHGVGNMAMYAKVEDYLKKHCITSDTFNYVQISTKQEIHRTKELFISTIRKMDK